MGAHATTQEWVNKLPNKTIKYTAGNKGTAFQLRYSSTPHWGDITTLILSTEKQVTNLTFQGKLTAKSTAETFQKALKYVAMDKIATPGLSIKGWTLKPMTSTSSFKTETGFTSCRSQI